MPDRDQAFRAFTTWMQLLQTHAIPAFPLRPKTLDPDTAFDGDYDLVADPRAMPRIVAAAVDAATRHRTAIEVDQSRLFKTKLRFLTDDPEVAVLAEVWPHAELRVRGAPAAVPWAQIDRLRREGGHLPPAVHALLYIGHLDHKRKDLCGEEVRQRLRRLLTQLDQEHDQASRRSRVIIERLIDDPGALADASPAAVAALRELGVKTRRLTKATPRRVAAAIGRRLRRQDGLRLVPFIGPDGVGKSALIDAAERGGRLDDLHPERFIFKKAFRDAMPIRLLLRVSLRRDRHSGDKTARNLLEERHPHLVLLSALARWPRLWASRTRRAGNTGCPRIVLIDRYFWDYLLQLRDPGQPPRRVTGHRLYGKFIPRPHRVVVLTCPTDVIHARKDELSAEAITALYRTYTEHLTWTRVPHVLLLSTEIPLDADNAALIRFLRGDA